MSAASTKSPTPKSSRSPSSSRSSSPYQEPEGSPTKPEEAQSREAAPSDAEILCSLIQRDNLSALKQFLGDADPPTAADERFAEAVLTAPLHPAEPPPAFGENGIFLCAYLGRDGLLQYLTAQFRFVTRSLLAPVLTKLIVYQRFDAVLKICALHRPLLTHVDGPEQRTLLHAASLHRKPPVEFIRRLLREVRRCTAVPLPTFINQPDAAGNTALHLIALKSTGKDGQIAAKDLIHEGAQPGLLNATGKDVRSLAANPYIRDLLAFSGPAPRAIPKIDEESRREIDQCASVEKFPQLKPIEVPPTDPMLLVPPLPFIPAEDGPKAYKQRIKKCTVEELDSITNRLAVQSLEIRRLWMDSQLSTIEAKDRSRSRLLSADECQATTQRLYDDELALRENRKQELRGRLLRPLTPSSALDPQAIEESSTRLGGVAAVMHATKLREDLLARYSPPRKRRPLTKELQRANALRLHDASTAHIRETNQRLFEEYCKKPEGRFARSTPPLSREEVQQMADRLARKR